MEHLLIFTQKADVILTKQIIRKYLSRHPGKTLKQRQKTNIFFKISFRTKSRKSGSDLERVWRQPRPSGRVLQHNDEPTRL